MQCTVPPAAGKGQAKGGGEVGSRQQRGGGEGLRAAQQRVQRSWAAAGMGCSGQPRRTVHPFHSSTGPMATNTGCRAASPCELLHTVVHAHCRALGRRKPRGGGPTHLDCRQHLVRGAVGEAQLALHERRHDGLQGPPL